MLQHYHIAVFYLRPGFFDKFGRHKVVGAFDNDDAVIALGKGNMCGAGSYAVYGFHISCIYSVGFKIF